MPVDDTTLQEVEAQLALRGLAARLRMSLSQSADPQRAARLVVDVLSVSGQDSHLGDVWALRAERLLRILSALCGAAPFFAPILTRHPDWLLRLCEEDFSTPRTPADYAACRARLPDTSPADAGEILRRWKYYELARITVRDLSDDLVPEQCAGETLAELSSLADALLSHALHVATARLESSAGAPSWQGPGGENVALRFCVLALGKLGSEELNYSSDVDLIYVFESPPASTEGSLQDGPSDLSPDEYFTRLAQDFGRVVGETTGEGFLYRIDLDLRPEGSAGPLVVSSDMLADYYEAWAATWEKAAFMKARPVAGDLRLGWQVIRTIDPIIYRSSMDFAAVSAIKEMKEKIEAAKGRSGSEFDVKIGAGGIRDVEFVVQALQLLHGGRIPQVRERSTQRALTALAEVGVLPAERSAGLLAAYRFLRRTENRLQMEGERQIHRLPKERPALERLARASGFLQEDGLAMFEQTLDGHRQRIRQIFASLFHVDGSDRILLLFERYVPRLLVTPGTREMIEDLAEQFARAIAAAAHPERAMNNLDRFIQGVGARTFFYGLLLDRPELVPRLAALFAASEYLSGYLASHPRLIEPIFSDPNVLLLSRDELLQSLLSIRRDLALEAQRDEAELELDALRLFHNRELVNVGLLDQGDKVTPAEAEAALTDIAEVCVDQGLTFARAEMAKRAPNLCAVAGAGEFLVVGMGKLASRELTYGSDLDVVFLYDIAARAESDLVEAQEYFVRLAQKLIWVLQTRTSEGVCYLIDARLRPSGSQGMLVSSLATFEHYHRTSAHLWERQALLRARPVAGDVQLATAFDALRYDILQQRLPVDLGAQLYRLRLRMESELAHETNRRRDFKTGRGGLLDVESVVQFLQLQHGTAHKDLLAVGRLVTQLTRLERHGILAADDATTLRNGWEFLQLLSSRLRIVENRSISDLDEERGDLDTLAQQLGYRSRQRAGGARRALLEDYRRHTSAIRQVYLKVLGMP